MSFKCENCGEEVSNSKMAGLAFGQISKSILESKGIGDLSMLRSAFDKGQFAAGYISGLGIKCPSCGNANWG
jgi:DNA-directed RNA polymerase subunit RPC12/RpoP